MLTLESGLFDSVFGLPVHPLVVHFAVVLLPLAALALIVLVAVPRWATRYGWLTLGALAVGTGAAFVAKESGEALAARVGEPEAHASWGDLLPPLAVALFVVAAVWFFLQRRASSEGKPRSAAATAAGVIAGLLALVVTGVTVLVGHSGAEAAWGGTITAGSGAAGEPSASASSGGDGESSASATPSVTTSASTSGGTEKSYSLAEVAKHSDQSSCWSAVSGGVYDLTQWISQHPGGARRILGMCGTDATAAFQAEHGGQRRPEAELKSFRIGSLA